MSDANNTAGMESDDMPRINLATLDIDKRPDDAMMDQISMMTLQAMRRFEVDCREISGKLGIAGDPTGDAAYTTAISTLVYDMLDRCANKETMEIINSSIRQSLKKGITEGVKSMVRAKMKETGNPDPTAALKEIMGLGNIQVVTLADLLG